jgi:sugar lactone lactonase YvrE
MNEGAVLVDGLAFPESPRWHADKLWFSDMRGQRVMTADLNGRTEVVARFDDRPSGLGFLPDGTPLVVLMESRKIMRLDRGGPLAHADLADLPGSHLNDMVVDELGRAYVDSIASRDKSRRDAAEDCIVLVQPNGAYRVVLTDLVRPNGLLIAPNRKTLMFGSVPLARVTAVTIADDGSLREPRVVASTIADGICLDADGAIWVGSLREGEFRRFRDGVCTDIIDVSPKRAIACVLGGPGRRTLFMATARLTETHDDETAEGFIQVTQVEVPGAGWP